MSADDEQARASTEQERAERLADEASRWVGRVVGRAREEAEDIWAEAQTLRQQERAVARRSVTYGLAGAIRAGDRVRAVARGAADGARKAARSPGLSESGQESEPGAKRP